VAYTQKQYSILLGGATQMDEPTWSDDSQTGIIGQLPAFLVDQIVSCSYTAFSSTGTLLTTTLFQIPPCVNWCYIQQIWLFICTGDKCHIIFLCHC